MKRFVSHHFQNRSIVGNRKCRSSCFALRHTRRMAFPRFRSLGYMLMTHKHPFLSDQVQCQFRRMNSSLTLSPGQLTPSGVRTTSSGKSQENDGIPNFMQNVVTPEIKFYRDLRNNFTEMSFSDKKCPYGPPLVILLPWQDMDPNLLQKFIEFYGEKGFDIITVTLTKEQIMFPCFSGNAMNIVTELLEHLDETHKHRPYIFHGFSIGVYIYGEILAQFSDNYDKYRTIMNNVKGCLWDSPVDFLTAKRYVGKAVYPNNWFSRFLLNMSVRQHFKKHYYDSVVYWLRARENFCCPIIKVPNIFLISYTDPISNPCTVQDVERNLECNGIPIYKKAWWASEHGRHFEKYCYEYIYGMSLFFNLSSLFPDESGKYRSCLSMASLANLRLCKKARDNFP